MKRKLAAALIGICLLSGCGKMQEIPELQARDTFYNKEVHLEVPRMVGGVRGEYTAVFTNIGPEGFKEYLNIYAQEKQTNPLEIIDQNKFVIQVPNEDGTNSLMYLSEQPELKDGSGNEVETYDYAYLFSGFEANINSKNKDVTHVIFPFHLMQDESLESPLDTVEVGKAYYTMYSMEIFRQFYERYCKNYGIEYGSCVNMQGGQLEIKYPLIRSDKERNPDNLEENRITQTLIMVFRQDGERLKFTIEIQSAKPGES